MAAQLRILRGHNPLASEGPWAFLGDVSAYPLSHFILPFTMHVFFENAWMVLCCCYIYESFEAVLDAEFVEKGKDAPLAMGWEGVPEPKLDSLVGDPVMAILGLAVAKALRIWFPPEEGQSMFPSQKGHLLRRACLFGAFAVPSFLFLNWDPVLIGRPDGWTKEDPLPPSGFRLGDLIFSANYLLMVFITYIVQANGRGAKLYAVWAGVASFFLAGHLFGSGLVDGTSYQRLLWQWTAFALIFLGQQALCILRYRWMGKGKDGMFGRWLALSSLDDASSEEVEDSSATSSAQGDVPDAGSADGASELP